MNWQNQISESRIVIRAKSCTVCAWLTCTGVRVGAGVLTNVVPAAGVEVAGESRDVCFECVGGACSSLASDLVRYGWWRGNL